MVWLLLLIPVLAALLVAHGCVVDRRRHGADLRRLGRCFGLRGGDRKRIHRLAAVLAVEHPATLLLSRGAYDASLALLAPRDRVPYERLGERLHGR